MQNLKSLAHCRKQLSLSSPCTHPSTCESRNASFFLRCESKTATHPPRFRRTIRHPNPPSRARVIFHRHAAAMSTRLSSGGLDAQARATPHHLRDGAARRIRERPPRRSPRSLLGEKQSTGYAPKRRPSTLRHARPYHPPPRTMPARLRRAHPDQPT